LKPDPELQPSEDLSMSDELVKRIGDYQILDELGSGGMGQVYRVRNVISDRIEAMKILLPDLRGRQELAARFLREIKLMASLNHPNIAALRTAFTADNQLVMIMEYVEGTTVAQRLEHGPIPATEAVTYIDQVLNALSYAHKQHIIHRDIKPSNIMLTNDGVIKLMDFGIARAGDERNLTMTGATLGSLGYMSPEQVKGEPTDERSDLYSVGVSLYEMVTGHRLFQASSDYSIMSAHVKETPRPPMELQPGLPSTLNDIILIAIAKDPNKRFQTADAFRNALRSVQVAPVAARDATLPSEAATLDSMATPAVRPAPRVAVAAPVPAPQAAVVAATPSIPIPPQPASHRGLYMTMGAVIVLIVLVAAGIYLPGRSGTRADTSGSPAAIAGENNSTGSQDASSQATPAVSNADSSSSMPQTVPPPPPADPGTASSQSGALSGQSLDSLSRKLSSKDKSTQPAVPAALREADNSVPSDNAPSSAGSAASNETFELDELEHQADQLFSRASAIDASLNHLQQEQANAGYSLRADMVARQASLKNNLSKAQNAVEHGDVQRAKRFVGLAQSDAEVLERFLGR
jgi:serine/threonine-protein kinase